ncbi:uncharacterized protein LY89DRAFT_724820 [Mollisia scopiformis]|uniref:Uncharacterized protein n=1 Tax=Mollisia scopiformis TaxID=149040 RepID=A0A132B8T2_MOLSC|nr:uncharacterized protein LY89DRAFT_724820 [Mollisia scopiformis]KUJ08820.1 hypothetical protein LY89DRAFT_724820 [Mollisia scopiformis]
MESQRLVVKEKKSFRERYKPPPVPPPDRLPRFSESQSAKTFSRHKSGKSTQIVTAHEALTSTTPRPRINKMESRIPAPAASSVGTPRNLRLNKELPATPPMVPVIAVNMIQTTPKASGIPRVVPKTSTPKIATPKTGENAFKPRDFDGDSILALPDEQRRSIKLGLSGPTVRFSKDCDELVMGPDGKQQGKEKDKHKSKSQAEVVFQFRSTRTSDTALTTSRLARPKPSPHQLPTSSSSDTNTKKEPNLKSRMTAMLHRRSVAPATPSAPNATALFEQGLAQLGTSLDAFRVAAAAAADSNQASQFTTRVQAILLGVTRTNEARVARLEVLTHLEALEVAEVVAVKEAVEAIDELVKKL